MSKENEVSDGTHWWDHYYVRYFVGAIFGVALLLWLQAHARVCAAEQCKIAAGSPFLEAAALGTIGLAFCYLASVPVLTVHALRFRLPNRPLFFNGAGIAVAAVVVLGGVGLWRSYDGIDRALTPAVSWLIPFAVAILPQVVLLCTCPAAVIQERYRELAEQRSRDKATPDGRKKDEYIESYRHLREHGNACAILLAELAFALAVAAAPTWPFVGGLIAIWILPAAFVWFIGTWLEFGLKKV